MNTRTKIAVTGLLLAALGATATPAFAADTTTRPACGRMADGMQRGPLASLVTAGTITQEQATTVSTALRTAMDAARVADFNAALAALVANNTITQTQADAAKATASTTGKGPRANLASWTDAQRTALHTWLDANHADRATVGKAAVAKLVSAGSITQAQADAINTALASAPERGMGGGMGRGHAPRS